MLAKTTTTATTTATATTTTSHVNNSNKYKYNYHHHQAAVRSDGQRTGDGETLSESRAARTRLPVADAAVVARERRRGEGGTL